MLNSSYNLEVSNHTQHPHEEKILDIREKACAEIISLLLQRLIDDEKSIISEKLNYLLSNQVWNYIKSINGFKKNEKESCSQLLTSSRNIFLYEQLRLYMIQRASSLANTRFVREVFQGIPADFTSIFLEEFLDDFMKVEIRRNSSEENDPFLKAIEEARNPNEAQDILEDDKYLPENVNQEIERIQTQKQQNPYLGVTQNSQNGLLEGERTVDSELRGHIHPVLESLHGQTFSDIAQEYLNGLSNSEGIKSYIERPPYKLAPRVRNIIVFSPSGSHYIFSKNGIKKIIEKFENRFKECFEILIFIRLFEKKQGLESQQIVRECVDKMFRKVYFKIVDEPALEQINLPENTETNSSDFRDEMSRLLLERSHHLFTDYSDISIDEESISLGNLSDGIIQAISESSDQLHLRNSLKETFLSFTRDSMSDQNIEPDNQKLESNLFSENSGNILLEISRRFLSRFVITETDTQSIFNEILDGNDLFGEVKTIFSDNLNMDFSWEVYLPVKGIKVAEIEAENLFHELATSLSESYEIKFISPAILKTASLEATSQVDGGPILFLYENATACAFFKSIAAGDAYQALKIAVSQLHDAMEVQWYLTPYGHQYRIEPLFENQKLTAFCKKMVENDNSTPDWSIAFLTYKRDGVIPYDLNQESHKYLLIPARQVKLLRERTKSADPTGELSSRLLHCVNLFRKAYFSEDLAERFRLYWTILDILFSTDVSSSTTTKSIVPYRVSLFCLGIKNLLGSTISVNYGQARLWMREDIEDFYIHVRNPLIHDGVENSVAYERLMRRFEKIVSSILKSLLNIVIYKTYPDIFLDRGMEGIIEFLEVRQPYGEAIPVEE